MTSYSVWRAGVVRCCAPGLITAPVRVVCSRRVSTAVHDPKPISFLNMTVLNISQAAASCFSTEIYSHLYNIFIQLFIETR